MPQAHLADVPSTGNPVPQSRAWRAEFGILLALGVGVGPFLHFGLPAVAPYVGPELGVSRSGFGVLASALALVGGIASPPMGVLVDRYGGRRPLMVVFLLAGGGLAAVGMAISYAWVFVGVILAGLAMALSVPSTNLLVGKHVAGRQQGMFVGVKQAGVQIGQFLAGAVLPTGAFLFGWRTAFVVSGVAIFGGVVATAVLVKPDARRLVGRHERLKRGEALQPIVWLLMGYSVLLGAAVLSVNTYLPLYAFEELGAPAALAGLTMGAVGLAGSVSRIGCGFIIDRFRSPVRLLSWVALMAACAAGLFLAAGTAGMALLWGGALLFGLAGGAWNVVAMYLIVRHVRQRATGRATGLVMLSYYAGLTMGPLLVGLLLDMTGSWVLGWGTVITFFAMAALLAVSLQGRAFTRSDPPVEPGS